jgi:hypothetical protein
MMLDHQTRLGIAQEHADKLRETMLASKRARPSGDDPSGHTTARIYTFPKPRTQTERGAA